MLPADPGRQFQLVEDHIRRLREHVDRAGSRVVVYVERNLGFEAEHHKRALDHLPNVTFYVDGKAQRVGVITTEDVKHAMCSLVQVLYFSAFFPLL